MTSEQLLCRLYYTPSSPASFGGISRLVREAKKHTPINKEDVQSWLKKQFTYTLHYPARHNFVRNPTFVTGIGEQVQVDLVDMSMFADENDGYRFLLTAIDSFSKKAAVIALKNKSGRSVASAFERIVSALQPSSVYSDAGTEFTNNIVQQFLTAKKITHFVSQSEKKAAIAERFNRTLKERMFRYMTSSGSRRYIDVLDDLVCAYNKSKHRSIGMAPVEVTEDNQRQVFQHLFKSPDVLPTTTESTDLRVGDSVRVRYKLGRFDKAYYPTFGDQVFKVKKVIKGPYRCTFKLSDWQGQEVKQSFYREELQTVSPQTDYRIEKVIRRRGNRALVKYLNYPEAANEWIDISRIRALTS